MQLPKRLARRLMDLQFLPHILVKNPHIKRVYGVLTLFLPRCTASCLFTNSKPPQNSEVQPGVADAYLHAFDTLRSLPLVNTPEDNLRLTDVLQRLVDEHGDAQHSHCPYGMTCTLLERQATFG